MIDSSLLLDRFCNFLCLVSACFDLSGLLRGLTGLSSKTSFFTGLLDTGTVDSFSELEESERLNGTVVEVDIVLSFRVLWLLNELNVWLGVSSAD